jgi:Flp pilus assembly protein TadD
VRGLVAGAAVLLFVAGCASTNGGASRDLAAALRARGLDPAQIEIPFAVDQEMKAWAEKMTLPHGEPKDKLQQLLNALLAKQGMNLEYQGDYTVTAKEVFRTGRANCLSFTNIFVGLARELGVPAYFVEVKDLQGFNKEGDLIIVSGHVTAGYGEMGEQTLLDFTLGKAKEYRQVRQISDLTAIALFYSNRGAHLLREGDNAAALGWLKTAVKLDPELPGSWVNYGVALRRVGDRAGAEASYRRALEVDPNTLAAYQNLAALLRLDGKEGEALDLLAMVDRRDNRNPWSFLDLGDLNLRHGRLSVAERFYTKAMHLSEDDPETYAAMGLLSLEQGNPAAARRWLRKAEHQKTPGGARTVELQQRLARDGGKTPQPAPLSAAAPPGVGPGPSA